MKKGAPTREGQDRRAEMLWFLGVVLLGASSWLHAPYLPPPTPRDGPIQYLPSLKDWLTVLYLFGLFVVFVVPFLYAQSFFRPWRTKTKVRTKAAPRRFLPGITRREIGIWIGGILLFLVSFALWVLTAPPRTPVDPPWTWILQVVRVLVSGGAMLGLFIFLVCPFLWESAYGRSAANDPARIRFPSREPPTS